MHLHLDKDWHVLVGLDWIENLEPDTFAFSVGFKWWNWSSFALLAVFKFGNWSIVGIVTVLRAASSKLRIPERIFFLGHSYNSYAALGNPPLCGGRICARQKQFGDKNLDKTQQQL